MKPTPCPSRLEELIRLANLTPDSEARKNLKAIALAFREKRRNQASSPAFIQIENPFAIRVRLEDGKLEHIYDELALALNEIKPSHTIRLIRECPVCLEIFWAGRSDREACQRHLIRWRKQLQRQRDKQREAERNKKRAEQPFELTITTATIFDAVFDGNRTFRGIDDFCWNRLSERYIPTNIPPALDRLVASGFLNCTEGEKGKWYEAKEKLKRWRRELKGKSFRGAFTDGQLSPTH